MRNFVLLLLCLMGLTACLQDAPPIRSGTVVYDSLHSVPLVTPEISPAMQSRVLTAAQLHALDQWLHSHRSSWAFLSYASPRPSISVALIHDDGTRSDLGIILKGYTGKPTPFLVLTRRDHNGLFVDAASRQLSNEDISDLERLLSPDNNFGTQGL